jgi:hypothetical protein
MHKGSKPRLLVDRVGSPASLDGTDSRLVMDGGQRGLLASAKARFLTIPNAALKGRSFTSCQRTNSLRGNVEKYVFIAIPESLFS